jgi:predicted HicB family RNase H-like nuclease
MMLRVAPELKAKLLELAIADRRSLSGYCEIALQEHVEHVARISGKKRG